MSTSKKDISDEELEVALLHKLFMKHAGVKYHIYESDLPKGFPSHLRKEVLNVAKNLHKKGLLIKFPHHKENAWQLNLNKINEIKQKIKKFYKIP